MDEMQKFLITSTKSTINIFDLDIPLEKYIPIDFSHENKELEKVDITDYNHCQEYIDRILRKGNGKVAYGGYLEKRNLYGKNSNFNKKGILRNIHLGIDFWTKEGTSVTVPLDGKVHSFKNSSTHGNYGPTIILEHSVDRIGFFTLYGHLSLSSLKGLYIGKEFEKGDILAYLGSPEVNVGYAPHLHFQVIKDLQGNYGDYPGVCAKKDLEFYTLNCPDPNLLLKMGQFF